MNIGDLMTRGVQTCNPTDSLSRAAQLMWERDCGCLPVVDESGAAVGMITDRDVCMAAYTQGLPLAHMTVSSAASRDLVAVRETDGLEATEALMQKRQIRRIPVVDARGAPVGIVSMNDIARHARQKGTSRHGGLSADSIVRTLAAVSEPSSHSAAAE